MGTAWRRPTVWFSSRDGDTGTSQTPATAPATQGLPVPTPVSLSAHLGANTGLAPTPPVRAGIENHRGITGSLQAPRGLGRSPSSRTWEGGHQKEALKEAPSLLGLSWPQQGPHVPRWWRGGSSASSPSCCGHELSTPCCHKERMPPARPNPTEKSLASFRSDLRPGDAARLGEAAADGWRRDSVPPCTICILRRQPGTAPQHPQPHLPTVASPHGAVPTPGPPSEAVGPRILPKIPAVVPG